MAANGDVEVSPYPDLRFRFQPNKQLPATINISNPNNQRVAFKIKTTAPKKYVVRPSSGIMEPRSPVPIQVIMQAQKEFTADFANCKDKFMVQTTVLGENEQIEKDTFNKDVRKDLKEYRLRVIVEGPPAPPSPVPEASEADEDAVAARGAAMTASTAAPAAAGAEDATGNTRLRATMDQLAAVSSEYTKVKQQAETLLRERDDLRKQLDSFQLQAAGNKGAGVTPAVATKAGLGIHIIILVAIIAFALGHYLKF